MGEGAPPPADEQARERASDWVKGFHGAVGASALGGGSANSLRELALSPRSLGFGRIAALTDLPSAGTKTTPTRAGGARHVTMAARTSPTTSEAAADPRVVGEPGYGAHPNGVPDTAAAVRESPAVRESVAVQESLSAFLDRRLGEASILYLPNRSRLYALAKRSLDLLGAVILLVLSAPVMLALAVLIRLDSPGPAIFRQTRVTRGGHTFTFLKFRTMYVDARVRFPELYRYPDDPGHAEVTYYKLADDPRNTRVGRWLRRTTLDELPNLFNVLTGELSLVGPRPDLPELVRLYRPEELTCLFTKAGLTGLAQVSGRSLLTIRERLTLDMRYVAHQTLMLDLRILWRTVVIVLLGRGAF